MISFVKVIYRLKYRGYILGNKVIPLLQKGDITGYTMDNTENKTSTNQNVPLKDSPSLDELVSRFDVRKHTHSLKLDDIPVGEETL